jgi:hypothetical protein
MTKAVRWTEEQLAQHQRGRRQLDALAAAPTPAPPSMTPEPRQTGTQKMQALGRQRDGKMNKTEARYAEHLAAEAHAGRVLWWAFEAIKLKLADNTHLTVDFAVMRADGTLAMHDVKGARAIYQEDAKVKNKVAARLFPFSFAVVYPNKTTGGWDIEEV